MITANDLTLAPSKIGASSSLHKPFVPNQTQHRDATTYLYKIWVFADHVNDLSAAIQQHNLQPHICYFGRNVWYTNSDELVLFIAKHHPAYIVRIYLPNNAVTSKWIEHGIRVENRAVWFKKFDAKFDMYRASNPFRSMTGLGFDEIAAQLSTHKNCGFRLYFMKDEVLSLISMFQLQHGVSLNPYITVIDK